MNWFIHWHQAHSLTFELILFFLACLVSIYSGSIRHFIGTWPRKQAHSFRKARAENQFKIIREVHDSAYRLVLYLAVQFLNTFLAAVLWSALFWLLSEKEGLLKSPLFSIYSGIIAGIVIGKAVETFQILLHLSDYERALKRLEAITGTDNKGGVIHNE